MVAVELRPFLNIYKLHETNKPLSDSPILHIHSSNLLARPESVSGLKRAVTAWHEAWYRPLHRRIAKHRRGRGPSVIHRASGMMPPLVCEHEPQTSPDPNLCPLISLFSQDLRRRLRNPLTHAPSRTLTVETTVHRPGQGHWVRHIETNIGIHEIMKSSPLGIVRNFRDS